MFNELSWEEEVASIIGNLYEEKDEYDRYFKTEFIKYISQMNTEEVKMVRDLCERLTKKEET